MDPTEYHEVPIDIPTEDPVTDKTTTENVVAEPVPTAAATAPEPTVQPESLASSSAQEPIAVPPLDPELLAALGESTSDTPEFGDEIHENLATLWLPLLKKGLPKENKEKILKENLVPKNCRLLQAPKLNAEISAAVSDMVRNRDKKLSTQQQQLGAGITAVNKAMTTLLTSDDKTKTLKCLSDGSRILSDLHYDLTSYRAKLITPCLDKTFLRVLQDTERDETLFGNTLAEKIKASKTIERQGHQIKRTNPAVKPPTTFRFPYSGNSMGPPRYPFPSNRGGRGGPRRPAPTTRRTFPSANTHGPRPSSSQNKNRPQQ